MNRILRHLTVLNIVIAILLFFLIERTVLPMLSLKIRSVVPQTKAAAETVPAAAKPAESKAPFPADYVVIADQNIFHPDRKIPVPKVEAPPLPKPDFVLYGTLNTGDVKIAYMEDRKMPQNSPTRGKKQIPVKVGESLSGFVLKDVQSDRVVMARGDEQLVVVLNDAHTPKTRETSAAPAASAPTASVGQPFPQPASAATPPTFQQPVSSQTVGQAGPSSVMPRAESQTQQPGQRTPAPVRGGGLIGGPRLFSP